MDEAKFLIKTRHRALINKECIVIVDRVSYICFLKEENTSTFLNAAKRIVREEEDSEISSSPADVNTLGEESSQDCEVSKVPLSKGSMLIETSE